MPGVNDKKYIINEIVDDACFNAKKLYDIYLRLREEAYKGKWKFISEQNIEFEYHTYYQTIKLDINFIDSNRHFHKILINLFPDDGRESPNEDILGMRYSFEGYFGEYVTSTKSFINYISDYIASEGFKFKPFLCPNVIQDNKGKQIVSYYEGLDFHISIDNLKDTIYSLLDIVITKIKPLHWFFSPVLQIRNINEAYYYLAEVKSKLQLESIKGRWKGVTPDCFKVERYDGEVSCELSFQVKDVWELCLFATIADCKDYNGMYCSFYCYPNDGLSDSIKIQLHTLFGEFIDTLKCAKGNTYVGGGKIEDHFIHLQYFYIEDTFDVFCSMLDEIVPKVQSYNFQIPDEQVQLTEKIVAVKTQLEKALSTQLQVVTEAEKVNNKLKHGSFKITY